MDNFTYNIIWWLYFWHLYTIKSLYNAILFIKVQLTSHTESAREPTSSRAEPPLSACWVNEPSLVCQRAAPCFQPYAQMRSLTPHRLARPPPLWMRPRKVVGAHLCPFGPIWRTTSSTSDPMASSMSPFTMFLARRPTEGRGGVTGGGRRRCGGRRRHAGQMERP
jgi:hypothetical protein